MVRIWGIVIGVHVALLVATIVSHDRPDMLWTKKPVVIRTVVSAPQRSVSVAAPQKKSSGKETAKAVPQKTASVAPAAPAQVAKKPATTPKTNTEVAKKPAPPKTASTVSVTEPSKKPASPKKEEKQEVIPEQLLQDLEASLNKIENKPNKFSGKKIGDVPKFNHSLQIDRLDNLDSKETEYQLGLVSYLQQALHLPEYGEVKMEITLRPDGTVANLKVLEAESVKNRNYLEKSLPLLRFPTYDKNIRTFVLTFCNET